MSQTASDIASEIELVRQSRPIDLVHLARQTLGDPHLEQEVLRMFDAVVELQQGRVKRGDSDTEIAEGLHALKGASAGVGARGVMVQAKAAEEEFDREGALSAECLSDLDMAVVEAREYIQELLAASPAH